MPGPDGALRPRRRDFEASRQRLLSAAREILAERGLEALTVSEVAQRAGLNRTTAYQHFRTRDSLSTALMTELADELMGMLHDARPIWDHVDHMMLYFVDHPEVARLTLHQLLATSPLPGGAWNSYLEQIRKIARSRKAQPGVDAEMLSHALMCVGVLWPLVAYTQYESAAEARGATRRLAAELRRLLIHGVLRPEAWQDLPKSLEESKPTDARPRKAPARRARPPAGSRLRRV